MKEEKMFTLTAEEMAEKVEKLDLVGIANALESLYYLVGDLMEEYFNRLDANVEESAHMILYDYDRVRAVMLAVNEMIIQARQQMNALQVDVF